MERNINMAIIRIEMNDVFWFHLFGSRSHGYEYSGSTKCNYPWQGEKSSAFQERLCSVAFIGFRYLKLGPTASPVWVNSFINYLPKSRTLWMNTFCIVRLYYTGCLYSFTHNFSFSPRFGGNVHPVCRWGHHNKMFCVATITDVTYASINNANLLSTFKKIHFGFKTDTARLCEVSGMPPTVRLLHLTKGSTCS